MTNANTMPEYLFEVKGEVVFHPVKDIQEVINIAFPSEASKRLDKEELDKIEKERKEKEKKERVMKYEIGRKRNIESNEKNKIFKKWN